MAYDPGWANMLGQSAFDVARAGVSGTPFGERTGVKSALSAANALLGATSGNVGGLMRMAGTAGSALGVPALGALGGPGAMLGYQGVKAAGKALGMNDIGGIGAGAQKVNEKYNPIYQLLSGKTPDKYAGIEKEFDKYAKEEGRQYGTTPEGFKLMTLKIDSLIISSKDPAIDIQKHMFALQQLQVKWTISHAMHVGVKQNSLLREVDEVSKGWFTKTASKTVDAMEQIPGISALMSLGSLLNPVNYGKKLSSAWTGGARKISELLAGKKYMQHSTDPEKLREDLGVSQSIQEKSQKAMAALPTIMESIWVSATERLEVQQNMEEWLRRSYEHQTGRSATYTHSQGELLKRGMRYSQEEGQWLDKADADKVTSNIQDKIRMELETSAEQGAIGRIRNLSNAMKDIFTMFQTEKEKALIGQMRAAGAKEQDIKIAIEDMRRKETTEKVTNITRGFQKAVTGVPDLMTTEMTTQFGEDIEKAGGRRDLVEAAKFSKQRYISEKMRESDVPDYIKRKIMQATILFAPVWEKKLAAEAFGLGGAEQEYYDEKEKSIKDKANWDYKRVGPEYENIKSKKEDLQTKIAQQEKLVSELKKRIKRGFFGMRGGDDVLGGGDARSSLYGEYINEEGDSIKGGAAGHLSQLQDELAKLKEREQTPVESTPSPYTSIISSIRGVVSKDPVGVMLELVSSIRDCVCGVGYTSGKMYTDQKSLADNTNTERQEEVKEKKEKKASEAYKNKVVELLTNIDEDGDKKPGKLQKFRNKLNTKVGGLFSGLGMLGTTMGGIAMGGIAAALPAVGGLLAAAGIGGIALSLVDAIKMKEKDKWGSFFKELFTGDEKGGLISAFKTAGPYALAGATAGMLLPIPLVGPIVGGLIGASVGAFTGWLGAEKTNQKVKSHGNVLEDAIGLQQIARDMGWKQGSIPYALAEKSKWLFPVPIIGPVMGGLVGVALERFGDFLNINLAKKFGLTPSGTAPDSGLSSDVANSLYTNDKFGKRRYRRKPNETSIETDHRKFRNTLTYQNMSQDQQKEMDKYISERGTEHEEYKKKHPFMSLFSQNPIGKQKLLDRSVEQNYGYVPSTFEEAIKYGPLSDEYQKYSHVGRIKAKKNLKKLGNVFSGSVNAVYGDNSRKLKSNVQQTPTGGMSPYDIGGENENEDDGWLSKISGFLTGDKFGSLAEMGTGLGAMGVSGWGTMSALGSALGSLFEGIPLPVIASMGLGSMIPLMMGKKETQWPSDSKRITSPFGPRNPTNKGASKNHKGVDMAGSYAKAARSGKVIFANSAKSAGNMIKIKHDDDSITKYMHLNKFLVKKGDDVYAGQDIGKIGNTTFGSNAISPMGKHLHFGLVKDGKHVDPLKTWFKGEKDLDMPVKNSKSISIGSVGGSDEGLSKVMMEIRDLLLVMATKEDTPIMLPSNDMSSTSDDSIISDLDRMIDKLFIAQSVVIPSTLLSYANVI